MGPKQAAPTMWAPNCEPVSTNPATSARAASVGPVVQLMAASTAFTDSPDSSTTLVACGPREHEMECPQTHRIEPCFGGGVYVSPERVGIDPHRIGQQRGWTITE